MAHNLDELYREMAACCLVAGVPIDGDAGGAVHRWVCANVAHRDGTAFFIVLGVAAAMADMEAQRAGWMGQCERAAALAWEGKAVQSGA